MSKFIVYTAKPHSRYKEAVLALENVCVQVFLHSKDTEEVCIGQTIDRIVNIAHQSARQTTLLNYFTH